jgi:hypothetical protein
MNTSGNRFDAIEQLIFEEGIRIQAIDIHPAQDLLLIVLNTRAVLRFPLSLFPVLHSANSDSLNNYELIAGGVGIHWPDIDEDLSLKGFLQQELKRTISNAA